MTVAADGERGLPRCAAAASTWCCSTSCCPASTGSRSAAASARAPERPALPILMLTAKGDDVDKIVGLELGADDYLAKPFNPRELLARMRAVLRRARRRRRRRGASAFRAGELEIDFDAREVTVGGKRQVLTHFEFELLPLLARAAGRVLSREHLMDALKGEEFEIVRSLDRRPHLQAARQARAEPEGAALHQDRARRRLRAGARRRAEPRAMRLYTRIYFALPRRAAGRRRWRPAWCSPPAGARPSCATPARAPGAPRAPRWRPSASTIAAARDRDRAAHRRRARHRRHGARSDGRAGRRGRRASCPPRARRRSRDARGRRQVRDPAAAALRSSPRRCSIARPARCVGAARGVAACAASARRACCARVDGGAGAADRRRRRPRRWRAASRARSSGSPRPRAASAAAISRYRVDLPPRRNRWRAPLATARRARAS